jgi:hypothetical protein
MYRHVSSSEQGDRIFLRIAGVTVEGSALPRLSQALAGLALCIALSVRGQDASTPHPEAATPAPNSTRTEPTQTSADDKRPLPDLAALMKEVEDHEKASEALIKDYMYTEAVTETELDSHGNPKKTESTESEIFYVDGIRVQRVIRKDGKELSPDDRRKESERIDKHIARIKEERAKGDAGKHKGEDEVTFARFLELGSFSNERRVMLAGRSTIAVDYIGDPKAKTRNQLEGAIHEMAGTVWVDEQDHAMARVEGRFINAFKIGGGLLVNVAKDTSFTADSRQVNGEVWLPSSFSAQGSARAFVFFNLRGKFTGSNSNYHKFKASSTLLPNVQEVETPPAGGQPSSPPAPPLPHN